jgi:dsDNA-specific endonuclease/ATPase MutS2
LKGCGPLKQGRSIDGESSEDTASSVEPVHIPIEDSLDLHTFRPGEVKPLLNDYLTAACELGFREVRIIHGKGTGTLRHRVHSILEGHPLAKAFKQAEESQGGWGATVVSLSGDEGIVVSSTQSSETLKHQKKESSE